MLSSESSVCFVNSPSSQCDKLLRHFSIDVPPGNQSIPAKISLLSGQDFASCILQVQSLLFAIVSEYPSSVPEILLPAILSSNSSEVIPCLTLLFNTLAPVDRYPVYMALLDSVNGNEDVFVVRESLPLLSDWINVWGLDSQQRASVYLKVGDSLVFSE